MSRHEGSLTPAAIRDTEPRRVPIRHRAAVLCTAGLLGAAGAGAVLGAMLGVASAAGLLVAALAALFAAVPVLRLALKARPGIPCLTYHSVSEDAGWLPWAAQTSIRPESLRRHLDLMERMGLSTLDSAEVTRRRLMGQQIPANAILLHFDDGYLDNWVAAVPILTAAGARATFFVSTDFIAPDQPLRPQIGGEGVPTWDGFMTWRELRAVEAAGLIRIEPHGTDHGRVPTGPGQVGTLTERTLGTEAWMQWAQMPGDKHDWYRRPPLLPPGTPIPPSAPSLSARAYAAGAGLETEADYAARVRATLRTARDVFRQEMGREPELFCWPQNETSDTARQIADEFGFLATTGGRGRNTDAGHPQVIGRLHAGQDYGGFRSAWIDDLALRAHIRCMQGDLVWAPVVPAIGLLRHAARRLARLPLPRGRGSDAVARAKS